VINDFVPPDSVVISAAGNLPGDLSKLWRDKDSKGYICEWGFSTMGYEVAAGLGAKLACPDRQVVVCVGDMSFLMASQEILTAVQHRIPYTIVVFDNGGGQSIRHLQKNSGFSDFAMEFKRDSDYVHVDFVKLGEGMGAHALHAETAKDLRRALERARQKTDGPTVIHLVTDRERMICDSDSEAWWDIPRPALDAEGKETDLRRVYLAAKARQSIL
jgi:3D-(3,5/4)-trihydroxycyclohexane-1,2-dione acylhydrolase (decyclizing)